MLVGSNAKKGQKVRSNLKKWFVILNVVRGKGGCACEYGEMVVSKK